MIASTTTASPLGAGTREPGSASGKVAARPRVPVISKLSQVRGHGALESVLIATSVIPPEQMIRVAGLSHSFVRDRIEGEVRLELITHPPTLRKTTLHLASR
jgi:hypothetical protein